MLVYNKHLTNQFIGLDLKLGRNRLWGMHVARVTAPIFSAG